MIKKKLNKDELGLVLIAKLGNIVLKIRDNNTVNIKNIMILKIEYTKKDGTYRNFDKCKIVGTYERDHKVKGFKVFDLERNVYRNVNYKGIKKLEAAV